MPSSLRPGGDGPSMDETGGSGGKGDDGWGWPMTSNTAASERTSAAMGPRHAHVLLWFAPGRYEMRPWVGFRPKTEQKAAGMRMLPPPSLPRAKGTRPVATA